MQSTKISSELKGYILGKTIGRGTFGKVKKAIHKLTGEPVAIKILEKQKIKDTSDVERVSRELHFLKIVRHSAIAQMYEIIETPKIIFIIMEYAVGGEYFDYVMEEKVKDQAEAFHYFSQVLAALIYLHKLRISHRDVKPENMLLDSQKRIKLVDFGLSNMYGTGQKLSTACGSPCYASPEMIKGEQYDPQLTDVWSLGIVLYTSVMAKLPFQDESTNALYNKIKSGAYVIDKKISPELKDLLVKTINTNPQKRIKLNQILEHPWYLRFSTSKQISGIDIGYQNIPVDQMIVDQMVSLGFDARKTLKYIQNNIKNDCTTTYYLLLKKNFKSGKGSSMDICSQNFQKQIISPFFSFKPKRYKSFDDGKIFENLQTLTEEKSNRKRYSSQFDHQTSIPKQKRGKSFSLRKQSVMSIYTNESSKNLQKGNFKNLENSNFGKLLKLKAQFEVKQRLFKKTAIKNKSLSISTQKVRKSFKKIDERQRSSITKLKINISNDISTIKNLNLKISNNENRHSTRFQTDFISEIYCPTRKKSSKKHPELLKEKNEKVQPKLDVDNLFWRKKSTNIKRVTVFPQNQSRPVRIMTQGNI